MPKKKKSGYGGIDIRFILIISLLVVIVMTFLYLGVDFGFDPTATASFISVVPYLFFFIIGLYIIVTFGGIYVLPAFGILGFGLAGLLRQMWLLTMITPEMMTGLTIESIMFWTVLISLLFGGVLVALTSRKRK